MAYMKRIIVSCFVTLALLGSVQAQETKKEDNSKLLLGIKAGFNRSILTNHDDFLGKSGFHIGFVAEKFVTSNISLQTELMYSTLGANFTSTDFIPNNFDGKVTLNYLSIPIMAKFYLYKGFNLQMGPQLSFALHTKSKFDGYSYYENKNIEKTDFAVNFGLGYEFDNRVFIETRGIFGVTNVIKLEDDESKNFGVQFSIGYKFN